MNDQNKKENWMGKKGFDEAKYYLDEHYEVGSEHSDERIKDTIKEALSRDKYLNEFPLEIKVKDGTVLVQGEVKKKETIQSITNLIEGLSGVKRVINNCHLENLT